MTDSEEALADAVEVELVGGVLEFLARKITVRELEHLTHATSRCWIGLECGTGLTMKHWTARAGRTFLDILRGINAD